MLGSMDTSISFVFSPLTVPWYRSRICARPSLGWLITHKRYCLRHLAAAHINIATGRRQTNYCPAVARNGRFFIFNIIHSVLHTKEVEVREIRTMHEPTRRLCVIGSGRSSARLSRGHNVSAGLRIVDPTSARASLRIGSMQPKARPATDRPLSRSHFPAQRRSDLQLEGLCKVISRQKGLGQLKEFSESRYGYCSTPTPELRHFRYTTLKSRAYPSTTNMMELIIVT
ncbi:hypothetical protein M011DRAFT_109609 [Sporormia fimetaria CBS 119925]|uniref:Uncharacterized protein n=1 Tax=Sporormia fimetaria CBS 119925 TaxID=1340428 RepID=A0A6A6VNG9_9PLEO|nr:hypothetical protein M011DRAFT_109609 [Sporormia fimetaria CBS 119925]